MTSVLYIIMSFFWALLLFYSAVTIAGIWYRLSYKSPQELDYYPSVALLIPAHNEGVVIENTLRAMVRLEYPGELNIYLLDDNSTDDTGSIAMEFSTVFSRIHYIEVPSGEPKGKSRVLNYGLSISESDYFIVYDADNQPEPKALRKLVETAENTPKAAGAVGYVKTINEGTNNLTRMIALEFQVFQLLMQCGRWALFKLGSLAGTNMLLRRSVLVELGGYDVYALAEDAELTVRLTASGYLLPVVPDSRTWEQEPERLSVFIKQRTRWLTGNIYLLEKSIHDFSHWKGKTFILTLQHLLTYLVFVLLLLFSHVFFIMSILGYVLPNMSAPLLILWFMSYVVYTSQLLSSLVVDKNVTMKNVLFVLIMYFTYAQIFIVLLVRSFSSYLWNRARGQTIAWDKTERFKGKEEVS
ncbi:glycosyltransferase family 2 protein [Sporosarcina sp. resist]|uniref:glycosyltransferase family 2 protein n=1 Tax=Sporosarcina sp. resist TaxID=2762563 RepID=UPI00164DEB13|nr:glycosyltransferase [Sporosarcina sp. resist]QNK89171.1 glycosyltransferase family 2 protein [Sporosarcina sp. resist]